MTPLPTGAWNLWRDEVRAEKRSATDPDLLMRAAWCDAHGLDALDDGLLELAEMWFAESAAYLIQMHEREQSEAA